MMETERKFLIGLIIALVLLGGYAIFDSVTNKNGAGSKTNSVKSDVSQNETVTNEKDVTIEKMPEMQIDKNKKYTAVLKTTAGDVTVDLNAEAMPITVNNFVALAKKGFYDKTIFHRVMKGFMIQGGDPLGDGTGGPGYKFNDEPFEGEYTRGTMAMANAGPNTNGSQFFIMHQDYPLPKNYVIFGKVVSGMETVDKIAEAAVTRSSSGENSKPVEPVTMEKVEIVEK